MSQVCLDQPRASFKKRSPVYYHSHGDSAQGDQTISSSRHLSLDILTATVPSPRFLSFSAQLSRQCARNKAILKPACKLYLQIKFGMSAHEPSVTLRAKLGWPLFSAISFNMHQAFDTYAGHFHVPPKLHVWFVSLPCGISLSGSSCCSLQLSGATGRLSSPPLPVAMMLSCTQPSQDQSRMRQKRLIHSAMAGSTCVPGNIALRLEWLCMFQRRQAKQHLFDTQVVALSF